MKNNKRIQTILQEISETLTTFPGREMNPGLLSGYCGAALFNAYYFRLTGKKKYLSRMNNVILQCIDAISQQELLHSHCNGISGITWCIQHLIKNDFMS